MDKPTNTKHQRTYDVYFNSTRKYFNESEIRKMFESLGIAVDDENYLKSVELIEPPNIYELTDLAVEVNTLSEFLYHAVDNEIMRPPEEIEENPSALKSLSDHIGHTAMLIRTMERLLESMLDNLNLVDEYITDIKEIRDSQGIEKIKDEIEKILED